jgi:hypothetical protein
MKLFHICTIANDLDQYANMKSSFLQARFDPLRCRYSLFDNSQGNVYEPYATLNQILLQTPEPYIIFCHQDVLLDQEHGFEQLIKALEELNQLDQNWAIAGNAGLNTRYELVAKINDSSTPNWQGVLPQQVYSLDENFFVLKSSAQVRCSTDLQGFHFYATDFCLNAALAGYSCYVIDFCLTHLSTGNFNAVFYQAKEKFYRKWCQRFSFFYLQTTCTQVMILSRYKLLRYLGSREWVKNFFLSHPHWLRLISPNHDFSSKYQNQ